MSMVLISQRKIGRNAVIWLVGGFVYNLFFFVYTSKLLLEISISISNLYFRMLCARNLSTSNIYNTYLWRSCAGKLYCMALVVATAWPAIDYIT